MLTKLIASSVLTTKDLMIAKIRIVKYVQQLQYSHVVHALLRDKPLHKNVCSPSLTKLNSLMHEGILRVGCKLTIAKIDFDAKHHLIPYCLVTVISLN